MLADCDWIIEAVIERVDIKQKVFRAVDGVRKAGSIVSSNTSTIPFAKLMEGMPEAFARDFLITHFFNPPRYMRLLELVSGPHTRPEATSRSSGILRRPARQERRRLQGHAGLHRQPHRHLLDRERDPRGVRRRADGGGGGRSRRQGVRLPEDRRLRPARPGRHRPRPARRQVAPRDAAQGRPVLQGPCRQPVHRRR
jgi:hypothetical protein